MLKITNYKGCQIHYTKAIYKYDIYDNELRWVGSYNTLRECYKGIKNLLWTRENIPF